MGASVYYGSGGGRILTGVRFAHVDLSRLTISQASVLPENFGKEFQKNRVILKTADMDWEFTFGGLGAALDTESILARALEIGRNGSLPGRFMQIWRVFRHGVALPAPVAFTDHRLRQVVEQIARERNIPALNARIDLETGIQYPERLGIEVDIDATVDRIKVVIAAGKPGTIRAVERRLMPRTTLANLRRVGAVELLSTYSTLVGPLDDHRTQNMALAVKAWMARLSSPARSLRSMPLPGLNRQPVGICQLRRSSMTGW